MFRSKTINTSLRLPPNILLPNHPFPAPPVVCACVCLSVCLSACLLFCHPHACMPTKKEVAAFTYLRLRRGAVPPPAATQLFAVTWTLYFWLSPSAEPLFRPSVLFFFPRHNRGAERPRRRVPAKVDEYKKSGIRPPPPPPPLPSPLRSHPTSPSAAESFFFSNSFLFSSPQDSVVWETNKQKKKRKKTVLPHPFIFFSSLTHQPPIYLFFFSSFGQSLRRLTKGLHYLCVCVVF
ncbi:hypothetical protein TCSYLVIO_001618, partial [Trypanosoma cruzi]